MKNYCKFLFVTFLLIIPCRIILGSAKPVQASEAGFTVSAELPDNQYDNTVSYYDLLMKPGQSQTLVLTVENLTKDEKTLKISPNTAYTANGISEAYDKYNVSKVSNALYKFNEIFSSPQKVKLAANETKKVKFTVNMPTTPYDGILEGAFYVVDGDNENNQIAKQGDFGIRNQFSMALGIILREHKDSHIYPSLKLREIRPSKNNYSRNTAILTKLENTRPATIGKLDVNAKVIRKGNSKALINKTSKQRSVAPNSVFQYAIPMDGKWINPGKYHLHLVATNGISEWVFDRDFEISFVQAMQLNQSNKSFSWVWILLIIITIIILLLIFSYYLGYKRNKKNVNIS
ncbi:DUF916 and DUF3324 domain-containing protein [Companilactobacillus sp. DQM5]|uniref:DUF916 and DUF3324 domain-containing protein n=1 Tax=Companilactobacillus sp. DQM5 TaxID=3463359 RepID=UPI00405925A3